MLASSSPGHRWERLASPPRRECSAGSVSTAAAICLSGMPTRPRQADEGHRGKASCRSGPWDARYGCRHRPAEAVVAQSPGALLAGRQLAVVVDPPLGGSGARRAAGWTRSPPGCRQAGGVTRDGPSRISTSILSVRLRRRSFASSWRSLLVSGVPRSRGHCSVLSESSAALSRPPDLGRGSLPDRWLPSVTSWPHIRRSPRP